MGDSPLDVTTVSLFWIKLGPFTMVHTFYFYFKLTPLLLPAESPAHRWWWLMDAPIRNPFEDRASV